MSTQELPIRLGEAAPLGREKVLAFGDLSRRRELISDRPVMILLAAGKGTRFGSEPKCAQLVNGVPLARHSIVAFRSLSLAPVICMVGYRAEQVASALGSDNIYIRSENPAGGTAFAVFESFCLEELEEVNPIVVLSMGDRVVPASIYQRLYQTHLAPSREADLTFLTAVYEPPRNHGKGRIIRDANQRVLGIFEQNDIDAIADEKLRRALEDLTEGNCPLYAIRARPLRRHLEGLTNQNAQRQYYLTDLIEAVRRSGGEIRTIRTSLADPEYDLLCADVTRPVDLSLLEGLLSAPTAAKCGREAGVARAASTLAHDRPEGQLASIIEQLKELVAAAPKLGFKPEQPVALGIAGGRLRIAFMHPDMGRFYGPAWQMPIGAADASGREQIVVLLQGAEDRRIHLTPINPEFQEKVCSIPSDIDCMYPGAEVADWYTYEGFGTRMAERLLLSLGYFTDAEIQKRREQGLPLPPSSLWTSASMRRPFSLVGNAIASMRTVRAGALGAKVQGALDRENFTGLRMVSTGDIPRGGFSSSSALTVATKNAINELYNLGIPTDMLVHLSCQAEYGTGVRAGSLDQATEQKGRAGQGTLISSNPRDNYRIIATYPVPSRRFHVLFPYSVDRDRSAWRWSAGSYVAEAVPGSPTTAEMRKMTGKAAELAALLLQLPLEEDFFKRLETDFVADGRLELANRRWIAEILRRLPLFISQAELQSKVRRNRNWYIDQLRDAEKLTQTAASDKADQTIASLFSGWRDPAWPRAASETAKAPPNGAPLRAMVGYLFCEVAKNFYLIHHSDQWIRWISSSQRGDRCLDIEPGLLPDRETMASNFDWEKGLAGPALMERWLERFQARPFDFNRGLEDATLAADEPPEFHLVKGTNFFRGLALLDLVEAMLKRAFGDNYVALRVNAAGQGDFFQVHVDSQVIRVSEVKEFLRQAFYRRFGLAPEPEFVEPHAGGGAVGLRLARFDQLPLLIQTLGRKLERWNI